MGEKGGGAGLGVLGSRSWQGAERRGRTGSTGELKPVGGQKGGEAGEGALGPAGHGEDSAFTPE